MTLSIMYISVTNISGVGITLLSKVLQFLLEFDREQRYASLKLNNHSQLILLLLALERIHWALVNVSMDDGR